MDAPPIFPVADVAELCPLVDAALLVVRARRTPRDLVSKSLETLGDRLIGIILNDAAVCFDSYYHYLSQYHGYYSQPKK
jgi:Mrp family chromosome partitioning ATPase